MPIKDELDIFCQNIKILRAKNNLSKREMAKIMGIGTVSLTKIETGVLPSKTKSVVIFRLYKRFNLKADDLFVPL